MAPQALRAERAAAYYFTYAAAYFGDIAAYARSAAESRVQGLGHTLASTTSDIYGHSLPSIDDIAAETLDDILNPGNALKRKKD